MDTSFERKNGKDEWLTPKYIIDALGAFDLDPSSPINRPWDTATMHYTIEDDGLSQDWQGRVWMNPPYGRQTGRWLKKLSEHGNGTALVYARTETKMFFDYVWNKADAVFFFKGRLQFYNIDGTRGNNNAGAPSCLVAYGKDNAENLLNSQLSGMFIWL